MHCTRNGCDHERGEHAGPGGPCNVKHNNGTHCVCYRFQAVESEPEEIPAPAVVRRNLSLVGLCGECGGIGPNHPFPHYSDYPCRCSA